MLQMKLPISIGINRPSGKMAQKPQVKVKVVENIKSIGTLEESKKGRRTGNSRRQRIT